ncbi:hypothetical protein SeMB42_g07788 [Synchytrium endobioticum]|uniref:BAR domain-containing protein n=1 Tax=Synchytrium endobioticum TaxID=286115 RepID=A0A507BZI9_9FUNG|nr:hypothetical protein SeMB42_g07788 [Synchytrium endobioticum]
MTTNERSSFVMSLPVEEAFADSPNFRRSLYQAESHALTFDASIRKMVQLQTEMASSMNDYSEKMVKFAEELRSFASPQDDILPCGIIWMMAKHETCSLFMSEEGRKRVTP